MFAHTSLLLPRLTVTALSMMAFTVASGAIANSDDSPMPALIDQASKTYCQQYTDEFVNYMLTQGTPDDVTMMENAVGYLDDGQWTISSETLDTESGGSQNEFIVQVRCTWTTPIEQLNAPAELQYRTVLDLDQNTVLSVEDGY